MTTIIIDIETGPLPEDQINIPPFEPPANIKDPAKIVDREEAYRREFIERAALDPLTGKVLAVGFLRPGASPLVMTDPQESVLIECAMQWIESEADRAGMPVLVGFNIHTFDLPFLIRRCWALGIPADRLLGYRSGRYWDDRKSVDLREVWQMGDRMVKGSLDAVCRCCGLGGKNGSGADFAKLLAEYPVKAKEYLAQDLALTEALYRRLVGLY